MTWIKTQIDISAPIERLWDILTATGNYGQWNSYLIQVDGENTPSETIMVHSVPIIGTKAMVVPVLVISVEPYVMRWEGGLPDRTQFKGDHIFRLEPLDGGRTCFFHEELFSGSMADAILDKHGPAIEAAFVRFNVDLAKAAEPKK